MDMYLSTIQMILNKVKDERRVINKGEMLMIKYNLSRLVMTDHGITQLWLVPLIEEIQEEINKSYRDGENN